MRWFVSSTISALATYALHLSLLFSVTTAVPSMTLSVTLPMKFLIESNAAFFYLKFFCLP
jgi:hypothetical protein